MSSWQESIGLAIAQLLDVRRGTSAAKAEQDATGFTGPGLSAIWCDVEGIADIAQLTGVVIAPMLYIGQAGADKERSGKSSKATTGSRVVTQHLEGNIGSSTLRQSLAAILRGMLALTCEGRTLSKNSEGHLSDWMYQHLMITVAPWPDVSSLEQAKRAVIDVLDPPLVLQGTRKNPFREQLTDLRKGLCS